MSKPLNKTSLIKNSHAEEISNESDNLAFSQVLNSRMSRRSLLQAGGAIGVAAAMPMGLGACAATGRNAATQPIAANLHMTKPTAAPEPTTPY